MKEAERDAFVAADCLMALFAGGDNPEDDHQRRVGCLLLAQAMTILRTTPIVKMG